MYCIVCDYLLSCTDVGCNCGLNKTTDSIYFLTWVEWVQKYGRIPVKELVDNFEEISKYSSLILDRFVGLEPDYSLFK